MANDIAKKSPISLKATIKLLNYAKTESFYDGMKKEAKLFGKVFCTMMEKKEFMLLLKKENQSLQENKSFS